VIPWSFSLLYLLEGNLMKAAVFLGDRKVDIREIPKPKPQSRPQRHGLGSRYSGFVMASNMIHVDEIVTTVLPLDQIVNGFEMFSRGKNTAVKIAIDPWA